MPVSSPSEEGLPAIDHAVGVELVSLVVADAALAEAHADDWISVQLLATASVLLPRIASPFVLPTVDVPASLLEAALALRLCGGRLGAYRLADAAEEMLARHLIDSYLALPLRPGDRWTLRDWLVMATLPTLVAELQAAAWFNRLRLLAEPDAGQHTRVLVGRGWSGAVVAARNHPFSISGTFWPDGQSPCRPTPRGCTRLAASCRPGSACPPASPNPPAPHPSRYPPHTERTPRS